jgi:hypothetical protein
MVRQVLAKYFRILLVKYPEIEINTSNPEEVHTREKMTAQIIGCPWPARPRLVTVRPSPPT